MSRLFDATMPENDLIDDERIEALVADCVLLGCDRAHASNLATALRDREKA